MAQHAAFTLYIFLAQRKRHVDGADTQRWRSTMEWVRIPCRSLVVCIQAVGT